MKTEAGSPVTPLAPPGARLIPLTQGQFAIVDEADYLDLIQFNWQAIKGKQGTFYAKRSFRVGGSNTSEPMHRRLIPGAAQVDHRNGNGLDNRRSNLRPATHSQNGRNRRGTASHNTSGYLGVNWHRESKKWRAYVVLAGRQFSGGYFHSAEEAARARDQLALKLHGEFVSLNFPSPQGEGIAA